MKSRNINRLLLLTPLLLFGVVGIYFFVVFLAASTEGALEDNLIPELIGFCLEGFFLVGLFSLIQRRQERERKDALRQSLRGALREILSRLDISMLGNYAEPASSQALEQDPKIVATLIIKLTEHDIDLENLRNIKAAAAHSLGTVHDLIPVAAQLSAGHMRWWLSISDSVRHLSEATDKAAMAFAAHKFLANLGEFDELDL
ncbi:MAG: hypothetical protein HOC23_10190 [Halieaceae bacterium]|jgi:hypothetical protein|nr:hypothetical protein [Halieaceae bacterium]